MPTRPSTAGSTNPKPQHWYHTLCRRSFVLIAPGAAAENSGTKPQRTRPYNTPKADFWNPMTKALPFTESAVAPCRQCRAQSGITGKCCEYRP
jgi:hypothetical protein